MPTKKLPLVGVVAQREQFLSLIHDEDPRSPPRSGRRQRAHRPRPRRDHVTLLSLAAKACHDAGPDQGGLAAPRRPENGQDSFLSESFAARRDIAITTEEHLVVDHVKRHQPGIGADIVAWVPRRFDVELRVLAEDRCLQGVQPRPWVQAQLVDQPVPDLLDSLQGLALPARAVLREG